MSPSAVQRQLSLWHLPLSLCYPLCPRTWSGLQLGSDSNLLLVYHMLPQMTLLLLIGQNSSVKRECETVVKDPAFLLKDNQQSTGQAVGGCEGVYKS